MICPGCNQFIGALTTCPNCGADLTHLSPPEAEHPFNGTPLMKRLQSEEKKNTIHIEPSEKISTEDDPEMDIKLVYTLPGAEEIEKEKEVVDVFQDLPEEQK